MTSSRQQTSAAPPGKQFTKVLRARPALVCGVLVVILLMVTLAFTGTVQPAAALTLALGTVATIVLVSRVGNGVTLSWKTTRTKRRAGARDETSELSWMMFSRNNAISFGGNRYIRQVAQRAVLVAGLDLAAASDQAACRKLLGPQVHAAVTSTNPDLTINDLEQILATLEALLQAPQQHPAELAQTPPPSASVSASQKPVTPPPPSPAHPTAPTAISIPAQRTSHV